jgi:parallel beta-helix repeat protein
MYPRIAGSLSRTLLHLLALALVVALVPAAAGSDDVTLEQEAKLADIRAAIEEAGAGWTADHTWVSKLPKEEYLRMLGGGYPPHIRAMLDTLKPRPEDLARNYPESWDWREMSGVTPVKNQGSCGSCWDFAAVGAMEGNVRINEGVILDLSEQQGLDCNDGGSSCDGGSSADAYAVFTDPGAISEECAPYLGVEGSCRQRLCEKVAIIDGYQWIAGNVSSYKAAIMEGPISSSYLIYEDFNNYSSGCYEHLWGAFDAGHSITIVGWDDSMCDGAGAWICKNSWGGNWGVAGYFYIKYNDSGINTGGQRPLNAHVPKIHLVPDEFSTIQNAIDNSERGDIVKVAGGTYSENVVLSDYVSIYGGYDPTFSTRDPATYVTIIDAGGSGTVVNCQASDHVVIDGFEIRNSGAASYGIYVQNSGVTIRDCKVHDNWRGINITYGSGGATDEPLIIDFCSVYDNSNIGIFVNDADNPNASILYTAIYGNGADGIYCQATSPEISHCTVAHNATEGVELNNATGSILSYNIIASNSGAGIACVSTTPDLSYNDVWGNSGGDYSGCTAGGTDTSVDPIFCDGPGGDVFVHASSPTVAAGQGALGVGCPEGPQGLMVAQDGASLDLSWSIPPARADVDHYVVYRDTMAIATTPIATVAVPDTTFTDVTVPACVPHYYWVSAVYTDSLEGAPSNRVTGELCYDGPSGLSATFGEAANELSWSHGSGPIDYYIVMRGNELVDPDSLDWVDASESSYMDLDKTGCPRDNYRYEIVPVYDTGWKGEHSYQASVDPAPGAPAGVVAEWIGSDIEVTWDDNCESDFRRYWVYRDTIPFSLPINDLLLVGFTPDPYHLDEGMNPNKTWFYRVVATDAESQESVYSEMAYLGSGDRLTVPSPYGTIQAAIDASAALDTVYVSPGTYNETITMKDGVVVMSSDGRATTTITSPSGVVVTAVGASDLTVLDGFTIDGQGTATAGIEAWTSFMRVQDCSIVSCSNGTNAKYGDRTTYVGNTISLNSSGVAVADSSSPFLSGNTISGNTFTGIYNTGDIGPEVGRTLDDANDIMSNGMFQAFNLSTNPIDADYNYWGDTCVGDSLFYGSVDYIPWTDAGHTGTYTECETGIEGEVSGRAWLSHNFPNPFNPSTAIHYRVPSPGGSVRLAVYDLRGRLVRTLVNSEQRGGEYVSVWRGLDDTGRPVGSGVYFYRLDVGGVSIRKKMVMLK